MKNNLNKALQSKEINLDKHIWEGWTVQDFIDHLEPEMDMKMSFHAFSKPFETKEELAKYCSENQPYYKKQIPDVVNYFVQKYENLGYEFK